MKETIDALEKIIRDHSQALNRISAADFEQKPNPAKWSKKEILGHLIDSAQNNLRRFIVGQYEDQPHIVYQQDDWVRITNYQQYPIADLVQLWILLNRHICIVLKNMSPEKYNNTVMTGASHSIAWLAEDYNRHLLHHLHQVLDREPIPYS